MDVKYNLQDLSSMLAKRLHIAYNESEDFVRAFFDVISRSLIQEKIVKVKGFGTFKLIDVQDRESINVNTGERIVIGGHVKVTFTPDAALRDQVNKPFIDFETVIINEGTDISAMEDLGDADNEDAPVAEEEDVEPEGLGERDNRDAQNVRDALEARKDGTGSDDDVVVEISEPLEPAAEPESVTQENIQPEPLEEPLEEPHEEPLEETEKKTDDCLTPVGQEPSVSSGENGDNHDQKKRKTWTWLLITFVLMTTSYYAGYYRILCPCQWDNADEAEHADTLANLSASSVVEASSDTVQAEVKDTLKVTAPIVPDSLPSADKPSAPVVSSQQIERYPQVPGGKYLIVGQKTVHSMKVGDNLYKISRKYYGHYDGVKYINLFNNFTNPDVIQPGYKIKIPRLEKVQ